MNISTSTGISTSYLYAGLRYRGLYDYDSWQGRFTSRFRYYTDDGFESRNQYDIERKISDRFLFRTTLEANWEEKITESPMLSFFLFIMYSTQTVSSSMISVTTFRPARTITWPILFSACVTDSAFYRDWLVVEVAPQVSFPKEYDREFIPGIIVKLEAEFGYTSYERQFNNIFSF